MNILITVFLFFIGLTGILFAALVIGVIVLLISAIIGAAWDCIMAVKNGRDVG